MKKFTDESSTSGGLREAPVPGIIRKWALVPVLMAVPFVSEGLNRFVEATHFLPFSGTEVEIGLEVLFLAMLGIYICRQADARRQILEALLVSEQRYRAVVQDQTESICRFLPDGTITFVNEAYCRLSDRKAEDLLGQDFFDRILDEDRDRAKTSLSCMKPGDDACVLEHRVVQTGSECRWYQWTARAIFNRRETMLEIQAVGRDITERKQAESEQERLVDRLKREKMDLEIFSHSVSHDLKSPLITIRGFLRVLKRDALAGKTDRLHEIIHRVDTSAERLEQLTDQLREISSVNSVPNEISEISFQQLTREALDLLHARILRKGVEVSAPAGMTYMFGNHSRLLQVMQNLIENAVKYMGDQPHPKVEIGTIEDPRGVVYYVRDNGMGVDPSQQEAIFRLFTRLDKSSDGTGLGLALVRRVVEAHGGSIWVESAGRGKGCAFYFSLNSSEPSHPDK